MNRKLSNILIVVLSAVIVFCGVMAVGTMKGWFGGDERAGEAEAAEEQFAEEQDADEPAAEEPAADETIAAEPEADEGADVVLEDKTSDESASSAKSYSTCTISIQCKSILDNMDNLESGKAKYVPPSGVILSTSTIEFKDGETVYDVLKRSCTAAGIPMSARKSSMGMYVEGINNLFEFDCGGASGWVYTVNGSRPNHACSEHTLSNGDSIVWKFTCGD